MKSSDFQYLPLVDKFLCETDGTIGKYLISTKLGEGQFSVVKLCHKKPLGAKDTKGFNNFQESNAKMDEKMAVKIIDKMKVRSIEGVLRIEQEIATLKILGRHENIVEFKDVLHGTHNLYIFTEYLPMDLFTFMESFKKTIDENVIANILSELLGGLQYLNLKNVVHRCKN